MIESLKVIFKFFIQKFSKITGFRVIIKRNKAFPKTGLMPNEMLTYKNIGNLKVILNRDELLELLPKNGIIAELGVDMGDFSKQIISHAKPKKLYLIDSWDSKRFSLDKMDHVKKRFHNEINAGIVLIRRGRSEQELEKFENNYFDWVYIDTTHSYLQTLKELELSRIKVKDGGIIAGHDYSKGNISKASEYGVVEAVNHFCIKYDWEFIYLTHETTRSLSYAIRKIR